MDDLFILSSHTDEESLYSQSTSDLARDWQVEDEGEVSDLLSVEITPSNDNICLRQSAYIAKLMSSYCSDGVPVFHVDDPCLPRSHPRVASPRRS